MDVRTPLLSHQFFVNLQAMCVRKIIHIVGLMALCLPLMFSCAREDRAPEKIVRPEGVQLYGFRAVLPEDATDPTMTWSGLSGNPENFDPEDWN